MFPFPWCVELCHILCSPLYCDLSMTVGPGESPRWLLSMSFVSQIILIILVSTLIPPLDLELKDFCQVVSCLIKTTYIHLNTFFIFAEFTIVIHIVILITGILTF